MHPDVILSRTGLAQTEIRDRTRQLTPRLRRLLLLVDGHTSVAGTVERYGGLFGPDIGTLIDDLHSRGYLAGTTMTAAGDDAPLVPADTPLTLDAARERALELLATVVGPVGGRLGAGAARQMERLNGARDADGWRAALGELDAALPRLVGRRDLERVRTALAGLVAVQVEVASVPLTALPAALDQVRRRTLALLAESVGPVGGRMNAAAARRIERLEAVTTPEDLHAALSELESALPRLVARTELDRVRVTLGRLRRTAERAES